MWGRPSLRLVVTVHEFKITRQGHCLGKTEWLMQTDAHRHGHKQNDMVLLIYPRLVTLITFRSGMDVIRCSDIGYRL